MGDESSNPGDPRPQAGDRLHDLLRRRFFRHHGYVPGDPDQVIYVWFDALGNYITGLGYGTDEAAARSENLPGTQSIRSLWRKNSAPMRCAIISCGTSARPATPTFRANA